MTGNALVVGFGNSMRSDDGLGWHVAQHLSDDSRLAGTVVLQRHQLLPELAHDLSSVDLVVFVDASTSLLPGQVAVERAGVVEGSARWSHHVSPSMLLTLCHELYGSAPSAYLVSCGVDSIEMGEHLSTIVDAAMPAVLDAVIGIVAAGAPAA